MSIISNISSVDEYKDERIQAFSRNHIQPKSKHFFGDLTSLPSKHKSNETINVVYRDKSKSNLRLNLGFQQYLFTKDDFQKHTANNYGMGIVSFVGDKSTGKSFLADSIISEDYGKVGRGFSKDKNEIINSTCYEFQGYDGNPIQFFVPRKDNEKDAFIWLYLVSSVMILNIKENQSSQYRHFLKNLKNVEKNIHIEEGELSRPQLIIAMKNCSGASFNRDDFNQFLDEVEETNLFSRNIFTIGFPYPGKKDVKEKQILDVPMAQLSSQYLASVKKITHMIKSSKPKNIMGNKITPKFLSYILDSVTNDINTKGMTQKVEVSKIWDDIVEEYGVNYHNFYLSDYTQRLNKELQDGKPKSEYDMYSTLASIRRVTDRNASGFQNLSDDPIFRKYKQKVEDEIDEKEKAILLANQNYGQKENNKIARSVFSTINGVNYAKKIDEYNRTSPFQYQKADTLIDHFDRFVRSDDQNAPNTFNQTQSIVSSRWKRDTITDSIHGEITAKENQLKDIEYRLTQSKMIDSADIVDDKRKKIAILQAQNKGKEQQLKEIEKSFANLRNSNSQLHSQNLRNKNIEQMEHQVSRLYTDIEENNKRKEELRKQKETFIKSKVQELNKTLREEDIKAEQYRSMLRSGMSVRKAEAGARDTCCNIM